MPDSLIYVLAPVVYEKGSWQEWTAWSECTRKCGGGQIIRTRSCSKTGACAGVYKETEKCNEQSCGKTTSGWMDLLALK